MTDYACQNCGEVIVLRADEPPPEIFAFCYECGRWGSFRRVIHQAHDDEFLVFEDTAEYSEYNGEHWD